MARNEFAIDRRPYIDIIRDYFTTHGTLHHSHVPWLRQVITGKGEEVPAGALPKIDMAERLIREEG